MSPSAFFLIGCGIWILRTLKPEQFEGAEDRTVTWKTRAGEKE